MTLEDYLILLESPETADASHIPDLEAMLQYAPYCSSAQILLLKALHRSHDTNFAARLPLAVLHAHSNQEVYFLLHPKTILRQARATGDDWFSLVARLETMSRQTGESFEQLALKLRQARLGLLATDSKAATPAPPARTGIHPAEVPDTLPVAMPDHNALPTEADAKQYIKEHNYTAALEILRRLHLHNPKKSRYFADQIAFLEKVVAMQGDEKTGNRENKR